MGLKKNQTILFAALFVAFAIGLYYLYTLMTRAGDQWPFYQEIGSLSRDIAGLEAEIGRLRQEVLQIPIAYENLERIKVEHELATRVLPRESSIDQLVNAIRTKAIQAGVTPDKLVPAVVGGQRGRGAAESLEELSFTLDLHGSYDQIASFVNRMEEFESSDPSRTGSEKRFFQVSNIDITSEANGLSFLLPSVADAVDASNARKGHTCTLVMQTYRYTGDE